MVNDVYIMYHFFSPLSVFLFLFSLSLSLSFSLSLSLSLHLHPSFLSILSLALSPAYSVCFFSLPIFCLKWTCYVYWCVDHGLLVCLAYIQSKSLYNSKLISSCHCFKHTYVHWLLFPISDSTANIC